MEKIKIKALIFDVGGVLFLAKNKQGQKNLMSSYKEFCKLLPGINISGEEFFEKSKETYFQSTRGEISKEQVLDNLSKILNLSQEKVEDLITNTLKENVIENKDLTELIIDLKKNGYKTGILSIQWHLYTNVLTPKKYNSIFDESVISCFDKIRKPDPRSYKLILKKLNVKPEETLFVDDKQENLDAAKKLGIKTLVFENNKQFFNGLRTLGVS